MLYTITGADRSTGQDVTQTFDAKSPAEAESIASLSMLVSKVESTPAEPPLASVQYAIPSTPKARGINWAGGLEWNARMLRALSCVVACCATLPIFVAIHDYFDGPLSWGVGLFSAIPRAVELDRLIEAVLLLSAAVVMRIIAHAALAFRELAVRKQSQSD